MVPDQLFLGLFWDCSGTVLGLFWDRSGTVLGLFWDCSGTVLGLFWDCSGTVLRLGTVPIVIVIVIPMCKARPASVDLGEGASRGRISYVQKYTQQNPP